MEPTGAAYANVGFAERLLEVIDGGRRTATYKLAVLLALIELCAKRSDSEGRAPDEIWTRDIAEEVASLYWPQVVPFSDRHLGLLHLRQISNKKATIIEAVRDLRVAAGHAGATSIYQARYGVPVEYRDTIDRIEKVVGDQPLPRFQSVGTSTQQFPFIYEIDWSAEKYRRVDPKGAPLRMLPGAGDELLRLAPLIRPFVELEWTRMVAAFNGIAQVEQDLQGHLFGSGRQLPPKPLRDGLIELQQGGCFYCGERLTATVEVDHFLPRVRSRLDAIENLVLADRSCNNDKRDVLPARPFVEAWARRNSDRADRLAEIARGSRWLSDPMGTKSLARAIYGHLPPNAVPMWHGRRNVRAGQPGLVIGALAIWIEAF